MIEILLQAERTLAVGRLDEAERLYRQAADADPRNSIAVVGLARVALERGDETTAYRMAKRALGIDPENVAAQRLAQRLEEVYAYRGESIEALAGEPPRPAPAPGPTHDPGQGGVQAPSREASHGPAAAPGAPPQPASAPAASRSLVDRLLRRNRA